MLYYQYNRVDRADRLPIRIKKINYFPDHIGPVHLVMAEAAGDPECDIGLFCFPGWRCVGQGRDIVISHHAPRVPVPVVCEWRG